VVELGFRGNQEEYYDPLNSFLHMVIERRLGNPITLSVLGIEVGRRAGLPLSGIGLPGHFLLRDDGGGGFYDPFNGWERIDPASVDLGLELLPAQSKVQMLARMLGNLVRIYQERGDRVNLEWVLRLRLALPGTPERLQGRLETALRRLRSPLN